MGDARSSAPVSVWGRRASDLYGAAYAERYRTVDEEIRHGDLVTTFGQWLGSVCGSFGREITALDLGCGTGRYFWALRRVRKLVAIDVSPAMLAHATRPVDADDVRIDELTLIEGDFLTAAIEPGMFDLVYSIGVLGEHVPLDTAVVWRVVQWLRPGGRFAFTAVHRDSFSIPRTTKRRLAERLLRLTPRAVQSPLRARLLAGGLYVDEPYIEELLAASGFTIETLTRHRSDVHEHCLCVARRTA